MKVVEMHYTALEVAMLLRLHRLTVVAKMKAGEFGQAYNAGTEKQPDWRIPASGVNAWLESRRLFTELGVAARSGGELRRKIHQREAA